MSTTGSTTVTARAVVLGRRGLVRDLVVHVLSSCGIATVDIPAPGAHDVVVLVDPETRHWAAARHLGGPVVLVTHRTLDDDDALAVVLRGADAVLHTDSTPEDVLEAVQTVAAGGTLLSPTHTRALARTMRARPAADTDSVPRLTGRELDILESIDRGESVKQTARGLGITVKTVENLQSRLFRKLEARNRAQAVARAHGHGLITPRESAPARPAGTIPHGTGGGDRPYASTPSIRKVVM